MTIELTLLSQVAYRGREITAPRLRGLLALLAQELRTGCSTGRLVEGLWPDEAPERPARALQVLVSRVRAQLGPEVVESTATGYRLGLGAEQIDSSALLMYAAAGAGHERAGEHEAALQQAEAGLALWDGGADGESELHDPVAALRWERAAVHRSLIRMRGLALARVGRADDAVKVLGDVVRESPQDEEVLAELLRSEGAAVGRAAALKRYDNYRRTLRDELGADPGRALKAVYQELLNADAPAVRHGVPHEPNPLLGREADLTSVLRMLGTARVVTVVGPGGLGKTRLSYAVSRAAEQRVVHFVSLAGLPPGGDVEGEVAAAVGAGDGRQSGGDARRSGGTAVAGIVAKLGPGPALLVLDNCEQVVQEAAVLVQDLVSRSKELRVLATSRSPLGIGAESVYALPELSQATSVALFEQRARAARPGVELPADQVTEICRHLDGLPLAVELAAARVRVLSVADIAHRLQNRFALLRGGARDAPERHRTLRAVVEWSWNLLDPEGKAALRALSVFPGGFTEEAAEYLLDADGDALFLLEQLAEQSLIKVEDTPAGVRFRMLETLRAFGAAKLAEAGDEEIVTGRFLRWGREFGRRHHDLLLGADPQPPWQQVRAEQDNLVCALRLALDREDLPALAAVTAVLTSLWATGSSYERLVTLAAETGGPLSHFRPGPEDLEVARAAAVLGVTTLFMGRGPHAVRQLVTLRRLPAAPPDTLMRALAAVLCAVPEMRGPDYPRLTELCEADEPLLSAVAGAVASVVWEARQRPERALDYARGLTTALKAPGHPTMRALAHGRVGDLSLRLERSDEAYGHLRTALDGFDALGGWADVVAAYRWRMVLVCLQRAEIDEAEFWLQLAAGDEVLDETLEDALPARAEIALARGLTEVGLRLWRESVERLGREQRRHPGDPFLRRRLLELRSTALTAHALRGRLAPVAELASGLREELTALLSGAALVELPMYGTVAHALGCAGVASGNPASVRLIALAERLRVLRQYPTMSSAPAWELAENADRAAFTDAVSEYAALEREELLAVARRELAAGARDFTAGARDLTAGARG